MAHVLTLAFFTRKNIHGWILQCFPRFPLFVKGAIQDDFWANVSVSLYPLAVILNLWSNFFSFGSSFSDVFSFGGQVFLRKKKERDPIWIAVMSRAVLLLGTSNLYLWLLTSITSTAHSAGITGDFPNKTFKYSIIIAWKCNFLFPLIW